LAHWLQLLFTASLLASVALPASADTQADAPSGAKVRIETDEFEAMSVFYRTVLALPVSEAWSDEGDRGMIFSVPGGGLIELGDVAGAPDPAGFSIQLEVSDVSAEQIRIGELWPTEGPVPRPWGLTYLYLTDPSGVDIILYQPTPGTGEDG
tara:strand:+ start:4504 stop:4959 length:456 start_codon:yes stop_codon:yes gene_type:complete